MEMFSTSLILCKGIKSPVQKVGKAGFDFFVLMLAYTNGGTKSEVGDLIPHEANVTSQ